MPFLIPEFFVNALYEILKLSIEAVHQKFRSRKEMASELHQNCERWSWLLVATFDNAVERWTTEGPEAAEKEIIELETDFLQLDYRSLRQDSPIIRHLHNDDRFRAFAEACCAFYKSALDIKIIVHGEIEGRTLQDTDVGTMTRLWKEQVRNMLEKVRREWGNIQTL